MRRPTEHVIGDREVAAVMSICYECGWTCDVIRSDYGEDLVAQTSLGSALDPFRILIQVKSTQRIRSAAPVTCRVSHRHALRWCRSREPVVAVLWELAGKRGWYSLPGEEFDQQALWLSDARSVRIVFDRAKEISRASFDVLAWHLRLSYYKDRVLKAQHHQMEYWRAGNDGDRAPEAYRTALPTAVFELLRLVGIVTSEGLSAEAHRLFRKARRLIESKELSLPHDQRSSPDAIDGMAATLCLIGSIQRAGAESVPTLLADVCGRHLLHLLRLFPQDSVDSGDTILNS